MSEAERRACRYRADNARHALDPVYDPAVLRSRRAALVRRGRLPLSDTAPPCGILRLFAGARVGTDDLALAELGAVELLDLDIRPENLNALHPAVPVHTWSPNTPILDQLRTHHYEDTPFLLAANLRPGFYAPEAQYDVDVGTFRHCDARHPQSDLNNVLRVLRHTFPGMKLLVFATPPCRMTSHANTTTDPADKQAFVRHIEAVLTQLRYALEFGLVDDVVVEESCSADAAQHFVQKLNGVDRITPPQFGYAKVDAADYHAPSTRKRVLFARHDTLACLPRPADDWVGWAPVLGVSPYSQLLLSSNTWRGQNMVCGGSPCNTLTGNGMSACLDGTGDDPTLVTLDPVEHAKLVGCRPDDPKLRHLLALPRRFAIKLAGMTTCVQFDLVAVAASMQRMGCVADAHTAFWDAERRRRALFPPPPRGERVRWHRFLVRLKEGRLSRTQFECRLARLLEQYKRHAVKTR